MLLLVQTEPVPSVTDADGVVRVHHSAKQRQSAIRRRAGHIARRYRLTCPRLDTMSFLIAHATRVSRLATRRTEWSAGMLRMLPAAVSRGEGRFKPSNCGPTT